MVRNVTVREGDDLLLEGEDDAAVKNVVINMDAEMLQRLILSQNPQIRFGQDSAPQTWNSRPARSKPAAQVAQSCCA